MNARAGLLACSAGWAAFPFHIAGFQPENQPRTVAYGAHPDVKRTVAGTAPAPNRIPFSAAPREWGLAPWRAKGKASRPLGGASWPDGREYRRHSCRASPAATGRRNARQAPAQALYSRKGECGSDAGLGVRGFGYQLIPVVATGVVMEYMPVGTGGWVVPQPASAA